MNTAQLLVARSMRPSFVCNWNQYARAVCGGKRTTRRNVVRFADGSAVTFIGARQLPVEYVGGVK